MRKLKFYLTIGVGILLLTGLIQSCNSDDNQRNESSFVVTSDYTLGTLSSVKEIKIMTYKMLDVNNQMSDATALLFFPKGEIPKDGYRVVVWQHGTVGVGDDCAPSNNPLNANFSITAELLLAKGYVILAPDYEGLGTKGIHPYLNSNSEANSVFYAVKALKEKFKNKIQGDWFSLGQSQGGQSSIAVAERGNSDSNFKGAVAAAPASNLGHIILNVAPVALQNLDNQEANYNVPLAQRNSISSYATLLAYAAFAGSGIQSYNSSYDFTNLFEERSKPYAMLVVGSNGEDGLCLDPTRNEIKADIIRFLEEDSSRKLMDYPGLNTTIFANDPILKHFLEDNEIGLRKVDKPLLIIQGSADTNVPAVVTQQLYANLVNLGSPNVELLIAQGQSHTGAIVSKNAELIAFIERYMPAK